jgi:tripartite-type tricarboxylate transporter receptor subunit TctC
MVSLSGRYRAMPAVLAIAACMIASPLAAQEWPSRTVTIVVPLAAGSASDIAARVVADQLSKQLKATFIV